MGDFFENVKNGDSSQIIGESYSYKDNIKSNKDMKMGPKGTLSQLGRNVGGMLKYTGFLIDGKGASYSGDAGGNAYFLTTGVKCKHTSGEEATRQLYVNNQVTMGPKGLITGVIENSVKMADAPIGMFGAFLGSKPAKCRTVEMKTRDSSNTKSNKTGILTDNDIRMISACSFSNNENPITKRKCSGFTLMYDNVEDNRDISKLPDDYVAQFFYGSVSVLALYIIYRSLNKHS